MGLAKHMESGLRGGKGTLGRETCLNKGPEGTPPFPGQLSCRPVFNGHEWVFHALDQGRVRPGCSLPRPGLLTV